MNGDKRNRYEISCINNGQDGHFITLGKEEFENYKYKTKKTISEVKKLFQEEKTYLERLVKEKNQELKEINRRIIKTAGEYQNYLAYLKEDMKTSMGRKRKSLESRTSLG